MAGSDRKKTKHPIHEISTKGNPDLKNELLALITQNKKAEVKQALLALEEHELLPKETNELIVEAQKKGDHSMILFLKNYFKTKVHLGIPLVPFDEHKEVLIGQEPLNTTGDFYHVLAYVALSKSLGYDVPKLVFTYEQTNDEATKLPYLRDVAFLEVLGMESLLKLDIDAELEKPGRSCSNSRRLALRESIKAGKFHLLDQKATTAILAEQYALFGRAQISERIRSILDVLSSKLSAAVVRHINAFGAAELEAIKKSDKPYVVMHLRFAGKNTSAYNNQQDLTHSFILGVANFLWKKGYEILFVHSTSRNGIEADYTLIEQQEKKINTVEKTAINPFLQSVQPRKKSFGNALPPYLDKLVAQSRQVGKNPVVDVGKALHLQFFLKLYKISQLLSASGKGVKVIANTSGTTDAVSFVGHDVLNIHNFKTASITAADYQGYRILMQLMFMSVIKQDAVRSVEDKIANWLQGKDIRPIINFTVSSMSALTQDNKSKFLIDMAALCCVLGWPAGKAANTSVSDKVSAELLFSAIQAFQYVRARFARAEVVDRKIKFEELTVESSAAVDALAHTLGGGLAVSSALFEGTKDLFTFCENLVDKWAYEDSDADLKKAKEQSRQEFLQSESFHDFEQKVVGYNLEIAPMDGDGNCFFHSVLDQLTTRNVELLEEIKNATGIAEVTHTTLRRLAVGALKKLCESNEDSQTYHANMAVYIQTQAADGVWAEGEIIRAMANVLGVTIVLANSDNNDPSVITEGNNGELYFAYQVGVHFDSLSGEPSEALNALVAAKQAEAAPSQAISMVDAWNANAANTGSAQVKSKIVMM